jgi:S-formylglutathione hydrolase FrmB
MSCQQTILATIAILAGAHTAFTQPAQTPLKGSVERVTVHGEALAGNLSGDSPDRAVSVYLPPSYKAESGRRYPVVYMLHGFTDSEEKWWRKPDHWINLPRVIEKSLESGAAREMIVVMPDAFTRFQGSMYSNSAATGDWETFIAEELVAYVDSHYRTVPGRAGRGLAGHSMGGYGTLRIGMKRPDIFAGIYALSPCCLMPNMDMERLEGRMKKAAAVRRVAEIHDADFGTKAMLASAAAWSPNPDKPPLFIDLPWQDGKVDPLVAARWVANAPVAMVDQYLPNLKQFRAIAFDAGDADKGIAASIGVLDEILDRYQVPHTYEIYEGTHTSRVDVRIATKALPFFSENLSFE